MNKSERNLFNGICFNAVGITGSSSCGSACSFQQIILREFADFWKIQINQWSENNRITGKDCQRGTLVVHEFPEGKFDTSWWINHISYNWSTGNFTKRESMNMNANETTTTTPRSAQPDAGNFQAQSLKLLSPCEAAELLGIAEQTLAEWRCSHRYALPWIKVGKAVRYRVSDISRFLEEQKQMWLALSPEHNFPRGKIFNCCPID